MICQNRARSLGFFVSRLTNVFDNKQFITAAIIIYPLLFIWQGLDFTDTGYILTNFQQIFREPSSIETSFRIWLTDVIGGVWVYLFGSTLGLVGYRLAAVLLVYATVCLTYVILKPYVADRHLLWGLFLSVVFINRFGYQFNYNSLTALFFVLAVYFMVRGLRDNCSRFVFLSAFVLGLNAFIRLPNVMGFFLLFCIFFYGLIKKTPVSVQLRQVLLFGSGYLLAVLVVMLIMYLSGHLTAYAAALFDTPAMFRDPKGHHYGDRLFSVVFRLYKMAFSKLMLILLGLSALTVVLAVSGKVKSRALQYAVIIGAAGAWMYRYHAFYRNWYGMISSLLGVLLLVHLVHLFHRGKAEDLRLVHFASLLLLIVIPLGSANAFVNEVYGMYLAIPLGMGYISGIKEFGIPPDNQVIHKTPGGMAGSPGLRLGRGETALIKFTAVTLFAALAVISAFNFTYRDAGNRLAMAYSVDHEKLRGVLTTRERAVVVQELLDVLPRYVKKGDYLLAYEQISLVYFLTETKPYLYSAWPMLYSPGKFAGYLQRAQAERPYLPVIVRAKGGTENTSWPRKAALRTDNYYLNSNRSLMEGFIRENHYKTVWENGFFEILAPPGAGERPVNPGR